MAKRKKIEKYKRDWLNPLKSDDTGHIALNVSYPIPKEDDESVREFNCSLDIADCSRKACLSFDIWGEGTGATAKMRKEYRDRKKKVQIMREYLDILDENLDDWYSLNFYD